MKLKIILLSATAGILLSSCSVTRRLGPEQYLLVRSRVTVVPEPGLARDEQVSKDDLAPYIRQRPNKRLFGIPFYLQFYNLSAPDRQNWTKRMGEAPVIYDPALTERSGSAMSIYMQESGFRRSSVQAVVDTLDKRKIEVEYRITQGTPWRIGTIGYEFEDTFIQPLVLEDSAATLLRPGDIFNSKTLQDERQRITDHLKRLGYYNFSINNIVYPVDTVSNPGQIDVGIRVRQRVADYDETDAPVMENNKIYRLRNIYVQSDYDAALAAADSIYAQQWDTLEYRGVYFLYQGEQNVRPDVLMRAINLYPNDLYDADNVGRAYDNLMRLNYFRTANILFTELPDSLGGGDVTYIGNEDAAENVTQEGFLDCTIRCMPRLRQTFRPSLEMAATATYYGILATFNYQNRNLFKGAEAIDISLTTGYEFMHVPGRKNSIELGGTAGISFPRFIAPFRVDRYNRMNNVRTRVEARVNYQNRPFYTRTLTSANWGYGWSNNRFGSYSLRPIDISVVNVSRLDTTSTYYANLRNPYLINSFDSQLIAGISGSYTYNNQVAGTDRNSFRLRLNAETNGNLLGLLSPMASQKVRDAKTGNSYHQIFGIRYAQYARGDLDMSYRLVTGLNTALAARFYIGAGQSYGNSAGQPIPFERQFYAGGPNSMRGWAVRTLGPGGALSEEYWPEEEGKTDGPGAAYPAQVGNFKLESNLEFRFPVYKFLKGAVFADLGNIWILGKAEEGVDPGSYFRFDRFYDQLALNTGLGARLDFSFFLLRVDWGVRLHDPNKPAGQKWTKHLTLRNTAFSFSVGYPF